MSALAIVGGRVWDARRTAPLEDATVLIDHGRIVSVGTDAPPEGVEQIDAHGQFVMPGLVDMHVHVQLCGDDSLFSFLGTGITSVKDTGSDIEASLPMRDAIAAGERLGPRLFVYGPMLDGDPSIFGGATSEIFGRLTWVQTTPDEGIANVNDLIDRGVDGLKLYAGLRPDLVGPMIEAVEGRVPVTGHLGRTWASEAATLGINSLEHVHATVYQDVVRPEDRHTREGGNGQMPNYWTWLTEGWARADLDADYVTAFIEQLVTNEVAISPTTVLAAGMRFGGDGEQPGQRYRTKRLVEGDRAQAELLAKMREEAEREGRDPPGRSPVDPAIGSAAVSNQVEFLHRVHTAGGRVVPSTDVGAVRSLNPGFSLHSELALLVSEGFSNAAVLRAATLEAAQVLRADDEQGTLEAGRVADVLVIDGEPLTEIEATRNITTVVKDGVAHDPNAILDRIERAAAD